jgi:iron complex outermembrane receptor protein
MKSPTLSVLAQSLFAAGCLSAAGAALAQTDDRQPDAAPPVKSKGINEVIITAQKVAQPASKTPVALSVMSGEDLKDAGVTDARSMAEMLPNVEISKESGMLQVAIRGVTSLDMTEKGDPSAAFHIDGAYVPRYEAQTAAFFDLDRIEVLRGPQGTLYGRNATAGAINLITNKPSNKLEGSVGIDIGNYNTRRLDGMINVPINGMWALRAAVNAQKHDTYLNPGPNRVPLESQDDKSARIHLLGRFSADTSLLLTAESSKIQGGPPAPVPNTNFFTGTLVENLPFSPPGTGNNIENPVYVDRGSDAQRTAGALFRQDANAHRDNRADSFRGEFKTRVGAVDMTYQLASMNLYLDQVNNGIYFGFPFTNPLTGNSHAISHELRFNSTGTGPLRWVAGLYYFNETIHRDSTYNTYITAPFGSFTVTQPFNSVITNKSNAAFGQLTYDLRPDTRLTLGLRGTRDRKTGDDPLGGAAANPGSTTSDQAYTADVRFRNTSWKVGLDHDLMRNVMVYANVSTGYKAGGFNSAKAAGSYKPETLRAYEAGIKGRFLENTLQLSANVFHYDYKDQQLTTTSCRTNDPSTCDSYTVNAANSRVDGVELEGKVRVGDDGELRGSMSLTDAQFKNYKPSANVDYSGQHLDRAPVTTANLAYTHHFAVANGGDVAATIGTHFMGAYLISDLAANVRYRQPATHKSDASVGYTDGGGHWTVQAYVRNIEDEIKIESRVPGGFFVSDPRTYGVRVGYNF